MKTLYLECNMGAAGDMLMAALLELAPDKDTFLEKMNSLGLPGVWVTAQPSVKCGITGTHVSVTVDGQEEDEPGHHHHHHLGDITALIGGLPLPESVKENAIAVYDLIAQAESHVHGVAVEQIHFHEVGTLDAIADVVGVCLLMDILAPDQILASPVHVGSGQVRCAHGILPVPAPATAYILRDTPIYGGAIRGELCTPTGAALLKHFAKAFGPMPVMKPEKIGYGMGKKDFEAANCVRAVWGESQDKGDEIAELSCNLDDMTPEAVGFAMERLFEGGALDVFTTPIGMKKCRPGVLLTCLCRVENCEKMAALMFRHTTTLGVRKQVLERYTLSRQEAVRQTSYGPVRVKIAEGFGVAREKAEYEDLAQIAREHGLSLAEVKKNMQ